MSLHVIINFCGSVVLASLMKWAHYTELMTMMTDFDFANTADLTYFVEGNLLPILCLYGFIFLEYGLAILGIILLLVYFKQMKLNRREYAAGKLEKAKVMFLNFGMIVFFLFWWILLRCFRA